MPNAGAQVHLTRVVGFRDMILSNMNVISVQIESSAKHMANILAEIHSLEAMTSLQFCDTKLVGGQLHCSCWHDTALYAT